MPPPVSSLAGILDSPGGQSSNGHGRTLPDISLGSLGSSFHSEDGDHPPYRRERGERGDAEGSMPSRGELS
jgi:hypothetical protein